MISDYRTPGSDWTGSAPVEDTTNCQGPPTGDEAAASFQAVVAELLAQGATYLSAKRDLMQLRVRSLLVALLVGFLAFVAAVSLIAAAAVLLIVGAAGGLSAAFDLPIWAGELIVSTSLFSLGALTLYAALVHFRHASLQRTIARYERRRKPDRTSGPRVSASANARTT